MLNVASIHQISESQLRDFAHQLMTQLADQSKQLTQFSSLIAQRDADIAQCQADIAQRDQAIEAKEQRILMLTHEIAVLKRWKFGRSREGLNADQLSLLDETIDTDIAAIEQELEALSQDSVERKPAAPRKPRRMPLPADLPRREFHHEPASTQCASPGCGAPLQRMGEDVTEKLASARQAGDRMSMLTE